MSITNCEVGDMSNKHAKINIPIATDMYNSDSFFFQDDFLNLTGVNAVIDRSLAIHSVATGTPVQGCAPLIAVEKLYISTTDNYFQASQNSKFDRTKITPAGSNKKIDFSKSKYSVFNSVLAPNQICQEAFRAGSSALYNPRDIPSLDGTDNTPDRSMVGNLTGKHSNIADGGYFDEVPIKGMETIAGRSLGISYTDDDGSIVYTCSTLKPNYPSGSTVKMAKATFNTTMEGAFYFVS